MNKVEEEACDVRWWWVSWLTLLHSKFSVLGSSLSGFIVIIYITNLKYTVLLYIVNEHVIYLDLFDISYAKKASYIFETKCSSAVLNEVCMGPKLRTERS